MGMLDMLLGREQVPEDVSVMQPGPVASVRRDGLLGAVAEPLSYAPGIAGAVGTGADAYAKGGLPGLFKAGGDVALASIAGKAGPVLKNIVVPAKKVPGAQHTWKGLDNIERTNTDDSLAMMTGKLAPGNSFRKLGMVFNHPEFYKLYPEARNIIVRKMDKDILQETGGAKAAFDKDQNVIYLNPNLKPNEMASSIIHELNHYVQKKEGMLPGAAPDQFTNMVKSMKDELMLDKAQNPKRYARIMRQAQDKHGVDLSLPPDKLALLLYQKQQGEADAFSSQLVYDLFQKTGQKVPFKYRQTPIDKDNIFEDIFGFPMDDSYVDLTGSGTRGLGDNVGDDFIKGLM